MKRLICKCTIVALFIFLSSCSPNNERAIMGMWSIEEIRFDGENIDDCMSVNLMNFSEKNCEIPEFGYYCTNYGSTTRNCKWEYDGSSRTLRIHASSILFQQPFSVTFLRSETGAEYSVELRSTRCYIKAEVASTYLTKREIEDLLSGGN